MLDRVGVIVELLGMILLIVSVIVFSHSLLNFNSWQHLVKIIFCFFGGLIGIYLIKDGDEMEYYRKEVLKDDINP